MSFCFFINFIDCQLKKNFRRRNNVHIIFTRRSVPEDNNIIRWYATKRCQSRNDNRNGIKRIIVIFCAPRWMANRCLISFIAKNDENKCIFKSLLWHSIRSAEELWIWLKSQMLLHWKFERRMPEKAKNTAIEIVYWPSAKLFDKFNEEVFYLWKSWLNFLKKAHWELSIFNIFSKTFPNNE